MIMGRNDVVEKLLVGERSERCVDVIQNVPLRFLSL
jgi:hypothetical protein